jgi:hypothetical protein
VLGRGYGMAVITWGEGEGKFMAGWFFCRASKILLGGYGVFIIQLVVVHILCINVKTLDIVKVCAFCVGFQNLHCVVYGAK